jgi:hypothetical protein
MSKEIVKSFKKLKEDDFYEQFTPTINHLVHDAPFGGTMYETYGVEIDFINEFAQGEFKAKLWTIEEVEGKMYYVSGYHYVNRFGYIITEESVPDDIQYEVCLDAEPEGELHTAKLIQEITVIDPDTKGEVQLAIYKHEGGGIFAMDISFLDQCVNTDDFDRPIIPDPFSDNGVEEGTVNRVVLFD